MSTSANIHQVTKLEISTENHMPSTDVTNIKVTDKEGQTFTLNLYYDTGKLEIVHKGYEPIGASDQESSLVARDKIDAAFAIYREALKKKDEAEKEEQKAWEDDKDEAFAIYNKALKKRDEAEAEEKKAWEDYKIANPYLRNPD
jgi:hypothetical protein